MRCVLALLILLTACQTNAPKVEIREIPGPTVYVAVPAKLTSHPAVPALVTTSPLQCPAVANERRDRLVEAYLQLDSIKAIQGTEVP